MNRVLRQIPLPAKLLFLGIVPLIFIVYLSFQLFHERSQKIELLGNYIEQMQRSADISKLISDLQAERKYSFDYSLNRSMRNELIAQRPTTDSSLSHLTSHESSLADFKSYTFLDQLTAVRTSIDSNRLQPGIVMDYYSSTIYRLNTLNALPTGSDVYLQPVFKDLVAQKLLSEMVTFLGIMSANVYNALYTGKYQLEILAGTAGTYRVYKTYIKEFLSKASASTINAYRDVGEKKGLAETDRYLDTIFTRFKFDSSYNHESWEKLSTNGIAGLRKLQQDLLENVVSRTHVIYHNEEAAGRRTFIIIILSLLFVVAIVLYTIYSITRALRELKEAAQRISVGEPGHLKPLKTHDVIASLASSILKIDKNNKQLAYAANAIGKGQFDVAVKPRGEHDMLGNAIVDMKSNLQKSTTELKASNTELERFAYIASHDLQEPLRMVSSFLTLLETDYGNSLDEKAKEYIGYAVDGAGRMKVLVNDLLLYSRVGTNKEEMKATDMNEVMEYVMRLLAPDIKKNNAVIKFGTLPVIKANKTLIEQLFMNLVGNALKYHGEERPVIEIGYRSEKNHVFYVKDNGIGIDPRFFEKIFIIFQRLHGKTDYPGTGIGLAICKKIADVHKGEIWVESQPGIGSTFFFSIPKM